MTDLMTAAMRRLAEDGPVKLEDYLASEIEDRLYAVFGDEGPSIFEDAIYPHAKFVADEIESGEAIAPTDVTYKADQHESFLQVLRVTMTMSRCLRDSSTVLTRLGANTPESPADYLRASASIAHSIQEHNDAVSQYRAVLHNAAKALVWELVNLPTLKVKVKQGD